MPFAMVGFTLGTIQSKEGFDIFTLIFVVLCMVFARSAAMAFNRWLDRDIDAKNPRTVIREIPSGVIKANSAFWFVGANCVLFITCTWFINMTCFLLSPVALMVILGYSYTKRFTALCHLVLGLGLALAGFLNLPNFALINLSASAGSISPTTHTACKSGRYQSL